MRARKVDGTQKDIVAGLRAARIRVWVIHEPCDLLTQFWCNRHQAHCWQPLESKPLIGKKNPKARIRSEQAKQTEFLRETNTPVVTSWEEAISAINVCHDVAAGVKSPNMPRSVANAG